MRERAGTDCVSFFLVHLQMRFTPRGIGRGRRGRRWSKGVLDGSGDVALQDVF